MTKVQYLILATLLLFAVGVLTLAAWLFLRQPDQVTQAPGPPNAPTAILTPTNTPPPFELPTASTAGEATAIGTSVVDATIAPKDTPLPPPPATISPDPVVIILNVNKSAEYVDLQNIGGVAQDLTGWRLFSVRGEQDCPLAGVIEPGQTLRVWALASAASQPGHNCGYSDNIWNNYEKDPAVLYNVANQEVDRK